MTAGAIAAPECVQSWCPVCREDSLADVGARCLWCDARTVSLDQKGMGLATATITGCKVEGCTNDSAASVGMYAKLCVEHRQDAKANRPQIAAGAGFAGKAKALLVLAKNLDRARSKAAAVGSPAALEAELAEAMRRVQGAPNPDNLARLQAATKAMQRASGKGAVVHAVAVDAEREFRGAVNRLAQELRA